MLCALLHKLDPNAFAWADVLAAAPLDNCKRALRTFEAVYGVPPLMDAEDIVTTPDDKGMQLYMHYIIETFNKKFGPRESPGAGTPSPNSRVALLSAKQPSTRFSSSPNLASHLSGRSSGAAAPSAAAAAPAAGARGGFTPHVERRSLAKDEEPSKRASSVASRYNPQAASESPPQSEAPKKGPASSLMARYQPQGLKESKPLAPVVELTPSTQRKPIEAAEQHPPAIVVVSGGGDASATPADVDALVAKAMQTERAAWADERAQLEREKAAALKRVADLEARVAALAASAGPDVRALQGAVEDLEMQNQMLQMSLDDARVSQVLLVEEHERASRHASDALLPPAKSSKDMEEEEMLRHQMRDLEKRCLAAETSLAERTARVSELEKQLAGSRGGGESTKVPALGEVVALPRQKSASLQRSPRSRRLPKLDGEGDERQEAEVSPRGPVPKSPRKKSPRRIPE